MYVSLDTETSGLHLKHGCRPFFFSTWAEENPGPRPTRLPYETPTPDSVFALSANPNAPTRDKGVSRNWEAPIDPLTRNLRLTPRQRLALVEGLADWLDGNDLVFFNAGFDLFACATVGLYFDFDSVGGFPWSTTSLRSSARLANLLPPPLAVCHCPSLHDVAVLAHARNNKQPKPPAGLKNTALYYLTLSDRDQKDLQKAVVAARRKAKTLFPGALLGIDPKGNADTNADYWLPKSCYDADPSLPASWATLCAHYASLDAYRTLATFFVLQALTDPNAETDASWSGYEAQMAALPTSLLMEVQGLRLSPQEIDPNLPTSLASQLATSYAQGREAAESQALAYRTRRAPQALLPPPKAFNAQSQHDLTTFLYAPSPYGLGLPVLGLTGKAQAPSTSAPTLQRLVQYVRQRLHPPATGDNRPLFDLWAGQPHPDSRGPSIDLLGRNYSPNSERHTCHHQVALADAESFLDHLTTYSTKEHFHQDNVGFKAYATGSKYLESYRESARPANDPFPFRKWGLGPANRCNNSHYNSLYLFPSFNPVGITLTRYASSNPNGQNVSKKPHIPLRRAFCPDPDKVYVCIDYSQLELRLFAVASQDALLLDSFAKGYDFHAYTAAGMYGYAMTDDIPSHLRRIAKNVNFGIIYGAGAPKIAATSGDPEAYNKYSAQFPHAKAYMDEVQHQVRKTGYVETLFGYRLWVRPEGPHKGVNYIVQGTAGQLVKHAMTDLRTLPHSPLDWRRCRLVLNVHDELIFELDNDRNYLLETVPQLVEIMSRQGDKIAAVTPTDATLCFHSWGEPKPLDFAEWSQAD